ncbi:hypothetical protein AVEN_49421-1 [Araneus ventricosus]|uniref:Uncharacterized protein n=1 Tax=Araneus ventricosus TaxID=182803 RepID=A0A4Y2CQ48_ARAVE|nr:hypothetical protein AVEN_49421-1 [Araneus ventricosus]
MTVSGSTSDFRKVTGQLDKGFSPLQSQTRIPVLPQPAYSLVLAPCDYFIRGRICLRDNDSQVPKKCSDEGTGGSDQRRLVNLIYIFL